MNTETKFLTILCKVVDNYGDIGFVYRLSRSIREISPERKLVLVVSNLNSFSSMESRIDPSKEIQTLENMTILDWNASKTCTEFFKQNPATVILECFQCGRPEWMDELLFDKAKTSITQIVNVEYLTAEDWADEFHLLKSGTRSQYVKKTIFMPGFTKNTGGLVLDGNFLKCRENKDYALNLISEIVEPEILNALQDKNTFTATVFTYPRNFDHFAKAFNDFYETKIAPSGKKLILLSASSISMESFLHSAQNLNKNISVKKLPYLQQSQWDALLCLGNLNVIRGEDSFSRACLSGKPFVWHAYRQDEEFQLIKVNAICKRMEPFFNKDTFFVLNQYFHLFNIPSVCELGEDALNLLNNEGMKEIAAMNEEQREQKMHKQLSEFLCSIEETEESFKNFSDSLVKNGNLTEKLLSFTDTLRF